MVAFLHGEQVNPEVDLLANQRTKISWRGYLAWRHAKVRKRLDRRVEPFLTPDALEPWVGCAKTALCFSGNEIARRLGVSRQAVSRLEKREREGRITVKSLKRLAEAMDCELVYAIRPKARVVYSAIIWSGLRQPAEDLVWRRGYQPGREDIALRKIGEELFKTPGLRRENRWTERWRALEKLTFANPAGEGTLRHVEFGDDRRW